MGENGRIKHEDPNLGLWSRAPLGEADGRTTDRTERVEVALVPHAQVIRGEAQQLNEEFSALIRDASLLTPAIDRLSAHIDPQTPLVPEGQARIPMRWGRLVLGLGRLVAASLSGTMFVRDLRKSGRDPEQTNRDRDWGPLDAPQGS